MSGILILLSGERTALLLFFSVYVFFIFKKLQIIFFNKYYIFFNNIFIFYSKIKILKKDILVF